MSVVTTPRRRNPDVETLVESLNRVLRVSAIGIAVSTDVASSSEALCEADNYKDLIYLSGLARFGSGQVCSGLQLAGFVDDVNVLGESYTLTVPTPRGDETVVSPGFAAFTIRPPGTGA